MPSIKVTEKKGLFQKKATTAEPAGSLHGYKRVVMDKGEDYTLKVEDSGKIITLSEAGATTITLPGCSAAKGAHYTIIAHTAQNHVITEDASIDTNVLSMISVNTTATEFDHAFTSATLSAGAIGDRFEIRSDGTFWQIEAFANAAVTAA